MDQSKERLRYLLTRYASQDATILEENELMNFFSSDNQDAMLKEIMMEMLESDQQMPELDKTRWDPILMNVLDQQNFAEKGRLVEMYTKGKKSWWSRTVTAAAIILLAGAGIYYYALLDDSAQNNLVIKEQPAANPDISAPAANRAMITLADGQIIYLDSAGVGSLANISDVQLVKQADGKIMYTGSADEMIINTLTNPRGSKVIDMTLADGSRVWLNAGSSLTYPVVFIGNERMVEVKGEAYFEIAHDAAKPFIVSRDEVNITVLGTRFNVNAYDDEADIKVTLLEGKVRVTNSRFPIDNSIVIKPGQQARLTPNTKPETLNPDLEEVMAWKNGSFKFHDMRIEALMREIARWYDVDVIYQDKPTKIFRGGMPRNMSAAKVFKILEETGGVHFKIEGKKVIVME